MSEYPEDVMKAAKAHELNVSMGLRFDVLTCSCGWELVQRVDDTRYAYEEWDEHRKQAVTPPSSASSSSEHHPSEQEPGSRQCS